MDTGQDHLKPKSTLNPSQPSKSVELNEDNVTIATCDPNQSAAVPITPLRTIATTSQTEEDDDWWEDWSIKSPIEALDVDRHAESLLQGTGAVVTKQVDTQENLADTLTKRNVHSMASNRKRKGFVTPERLAKNWMIGLEAVSYTHLTLPTKA